MRRAPTAAGLLVLAGAITWSLIPAAAVAFKVPLTCSRGPDGQTYNARATLPAAVEQGATYRVRIDGTDSGKISQTGLNHIHGMTYDYLLPPAARIVPGSARVVAGTGTANVRSGARLTEEKGLVRLVLPGHVEEGTSYTPPSFELDLVAAAPPGTALVLGFTGYRVTANALVVGDLDVTCAPTPKPFPVGTTTVTPAGSR